MKSLRGIEAWKSVEIQSSFRWMGTNIFRLSKIYGEKADSNKPVLPQIHWTKLSDVSVDHLIFMLQSFVGTN